jgi:hypothetical protein
LVAVNSYYRGFPEMYNSCTGSASHGAYDPFEEPFGSSDFKLQNARPDPYCLYSQGHTEPPTYFPPTGNCFGYAADEWMTFQVHVIIGPRVGDEFQASRVQLWIAREGRASEPAIDWGPYNLSAGSAAENQRYGKIWLLPYNTDKDPSATYATTYTWYDELIVSTQPIADPMGVPPPVPDAGVQSDATASDASAPDASAPDASPRDAGAPGAPDAVAMSDAGATDGGTPVDAAPSDTTAPPADASAPPPPPPDAGAASSSAPSSGCHCSASSLASADLPWILFALLAFRRRR